MKQKRWTEGEKLAIVCIAIVFFLAGCATYTLKKSSQEVYERSIPSYSPDGKKIAFTQWANITPALTLVHGHGKGRPIFSSEFSEKVFLPDGGVLEILVPARKLNLEIFVMNTDGSGLKNLTNNPAADGCPSWYPDEKKIAFCSMRDGNSEIYIMNADGSQQKRLTNSPSFKWSPDWIMAGKKIKYMAFSSGVIGSDLGTYLINADGGEEQEVIDDSAELSPDGKKVVFGHLMKWGHSEIYIMNLDGSGQRKLAEGLLPTWSPDGKKIAFSTLSEICVMNADGSGQKRLAKGGMPRWSPDGKKIAFEFLKVNGDQFIDKIYVMSADGSDKKELLSTVSWLDSKVEKPIGLSVSCPRWSTDGKKIFALLVNSRKYYTPEVAIDTKCYTVVINVDGGKPYIVPGDLPEDKKVLVVSSNRDGTGNLFVITNPYEVATEPSPLLGVAADVVLKDPQNPQCWVEYGRACLFSNNHQGAEMAFGQALKLNDKYPPAYKHLGIVLVNSQRYQDAKEVYEQALQITEDSELWTAYGYCLVDLGDDKKALEAFQKSLEVSTDPVSVVSARLGASVLLRRQGDHEGAQREYAEALKINPGIVDVLKEQKESTQNVEKHPSD